MCWWQNHNVDDFLSITDMQCIICMYRLSGTINHHGFLHFTKNGTLQFLFDIWSLFLPADYWNKKSVVSVLLGRLTYRLVAELVILKVNKYPTRFYYNKKSIFSRVSQSGIALLGKPHPYFALEAWHLHWNLNFMLDLDSFHLNFPMLSAIKNSLTV